MCEGNVIGDVNGVQCDNVSECIIKIDDELAGLQKEIIAFCTVCDWDKAYETVFEFDRLNGIKSVLVAMRNAKLNVK